MQETFIAAGLRTPFSRVDGALAAYDAVELSVPVVQAMSARLKPGHAAGLRGLGLGRAESRLEQHRARDLARCEARSARAGIFGGARLRIERHGGRRRRRHAGRGRPRPRPCRRSRKHEPGADRTRPEILGLAPVFHPGALAGRQARIVYRTALERHPDPHSGRREPNHRQEHGRAHGRNGEGMGHLPREPGRMVAQRAPARHRRARDEVSSTISSFPSAR